MPIQPTYPLTLGKGVLRIGCMGASPRKKWVLKQVCLCLCLFSASFIFNEEFVGVRVMWKKQAIYWICKESWKDITAVCWLLIKQKINWLIDIWLVNSDFDKNKQKFRN